jgi:isoquinoline 1-oxidoreductase beta subunit
MAPRRRCRRLSACRLPREVYKHHLGGGFGRRGMQDYVTRAVQVPQILGVPVKLIWSREEDMRQGRFRPVGLQDVGWARRLRRPRRPLHAHRRSSISSLRGLSRLENGKDFIAFQGLNPQGQRGSSATTAPNPDRARHAQHARAPGFWRGVNTNQNAIWLECFMDELAKAAGKDPLEFRRKMMAKHPKHLAVLNAVADKIGWGTPPPAGVTRGIAQFMGYGSYVACAAEVRVSDRGRIDRLVLSTDCGHVVNPDQVVAQIEGSVAYGLGAALYQECTLKDGRVVEENFDTYPMMLMEAFPKIETVVMPRAWGRLSPPSAWRHRRAQRHSRGDRQADPHAALKNGSLRT